MTMMAMGGHSFLYFAFSAAGAMAIRLPLTSSRMYTSSAKVPLANTSKTSRASSRPVPEGRSDIIRSTSSRFSRTGSGQSPLRLVRIGHHKNDLGGPAAPGGRIGALDIDLGRGQPLGDSSKASRLVVQGQQQCRLLAAPDLGGRQRLLGAGRIGHHHPELAALVAVGRADGDQIDPRLREHGADSGEDPGLREGGEGDLLDLGHG